MRCISAAGPSASRCSLRGQISATPLQRPERAVVDRHQEVAAEEEVDVVRGELVLGRLEVDAVENDVQETRVALDLRLVHLPEGVLDGELVERRGPRASRAASCSAGRR